VGNHEVSQENCARLMRVTGVTWRGYEKGHHEPRGYRREELEARMAAIEAANQKGVE
jgi:hypothetical protein